DLRQRVLRGRLLMEALLDVGETLLVPERMIVAPSVGLFRPADTVEGSHVDAGQTIGVVDGPGTSMPIETPFTGKLVAMLWHTSKRLREGQPVAWLRIT